MPERRSCAYSTLVSGFVQRILTARAEMISLVCMAAPSRVRWALRLSQPYGQSGLAVAMACARYCLVVGATCARYGLRLSQLFRQGDPDVARFFAFFKLDAMTLRHLRSLGCHVICCSDNQQPHARGLR